MSTKELLEEALKFRPEERFTLVEGIIMSLDEPEKTGRHLGRGSLKEAQCV